MRPHIDFQLSTVNQHPSLRLQMAELTDLASRWKESIEMPNKYLTAMCVMSNQRLAGAHVMFLATDSPRHFMHAPSSYCDLLANMFPKTDMERRLCHEVFHSVFAGYDRECRPFVSFVRVTSPRRPFATRRSLGQRRHVGRTQALPGARPLLRAPQAREATGRTLAMLSPMTSHRNSTDSSSGCRYAISSGTA